MEGRLQIPQVGALVRPWSSSAVLLALAGVLIISYLAYRRALPKPLPDIPYNKNAAKSVLGDLPELGRAAGGGDLRNFLETLTSRLNSPIVQIFGLGSRPMLVVSDFSTTQDILLHRNREFERVANQNEAFRAMIPYHHIAMPTADPQFRKNREIVKDLMSVSFLHSVNAPLVREAALRFVDLWRLKANVAAGRPFDAVEDVSRMTFDIIKNAALGKDGATLVGLYTDQLRTEFGARATAADEVASSADQATYDNVFQFPNPPQDDVLEAQTRMNTAISSAGLIPAKWFHAVNNLRPHMRQAFAWKEQMLRRQVALAVTRMEAGEPLESALDYMIQRELNAAKKDGREPVFDSPIMYDELYGYIGAGHDTTATTFTWGLKHLCLDARAQTKARENLREVYAEAHAQGRQPTTSEILNTPAPYLDALIEEVLRVSGPVGAIMRTNTVDTTLMGRSIPKGTAVFLPFGGAGFTSSSLRDSALRSEGEDKATTLPSSYTKRDNWDGMEPEKFVPERWLGQDDEGKMVYDAQAGPMLAFSLGIRGCFGRRLAYLTLRMLFTLLLWNFELHPVPDELDSWTPVSILTRKPVQCFVRLAEAK